MARSASYGRRQTLVFLAGLMLVTFVASLDQTAVAAATYRIGESHHPGCPVLITQGET